MPKTSIAIPSLVFCCCSIAFLGASLSTQHWLEANPYKHQIDNDTDSSADSSRFKGKINFGLYQGYKEIKTLISPKIDVLRIVCSTEKNVCMFSGKETKQERELELETNLEISIQNGENNTIVEPIPNPYLISFGLWTSTFALISLSIIFGLVGAVFSAVNAFMNPVEFITGIRGIHVWNLLGGIFAMSSLIVWSVLFSNTLQHSVLNKEDLESHWTSENTASHGFSFWLVLISLIFYLVNSGFIILMTIKPWVKKQQKLDEASTPEGIIMLY